MEVNRNEFFRVGEINDQKSELPPLERRGETDLQKMAKELLRLSERIQTIHKDAPAPVVVDIASQLRRVIKSRRKRNEIFPTALFADASWDILLDLTLARLENRQISVSSLTIAAAVPTTTALRRIKALAELGMIAIVADPNDGRRNYVQISEETYSKMRDFISKA